MPHHSWRWLGEQYPPGPQSASTRHVLPRRQKFASRDDADGRHSHGSCAGHCESSKHSSYVHDGSGCGPPTPTGSQRPFLPAVQSQSFPHPTIPPASDGPVHIPPARCAGQVESEGRWLTGTAPLLDPEVLPLDVEVPPLLLDVPEPEPPLLEPVPPELVLLDPELLPPEPLALPPSLPPTGDTEPPQPAEKAMKTEAHTHEAKPCLLMS